MSKAWIVGIGDASGWDDYVMLFHADTCGKAKAIFLSFGYASNDYTDIRAIRLPELDDVPFTAESVSKAGFTFYYDEMTPIGDAPFINDCRCDICRGVNAT